MTDEPWPWRTMESAPKDGSDILVCCGPSHDPMYAVAHWEKDGHYFEDGQPGWMMWWAREGRFCKKAHWAEHWQPISLAPDKIGGDRVGG